MPSRSIETRKKSICKFRVASQFHLSYFHDLSRHGLFVKEAIDYTEKAIQAAQARGDREIRLIVGKFFQVFTFFAVIISSL